MSVLITGASGYLGRHLLAALPGESLALVRDVEAWKAQDWTASARCRVVRGELSELESLASSGALDGVETMVHLASVVHHGRRDQDGLSAINVDSGPAVIRSAYAVGARAIVMSSSGVIGCNLDPEARPDESGGYATGIPSTWPYYASKIAMEDATRREAEKLGVPLVFVRPPALQGPEDHRFRSTKHVTRQLQQRMPYVPTGGINILDVRDAAKSLAALVALDEPKPIYHLPGHQLSLREFFDAVADVSGVPAPSRRVPHRVMWLAATASEFAAHKLGRNRSWLPDPVIIEMAQHHWGLASMWAADDLGHSPRPLKETLTDTVAWLRAHHPELQS